MYTDLPRSTYRRTLLPPFHPQAACQVVPILFRSVPPKSDVATPYWKAHCWLVGAVYEGNGSCVAVCWHTCCSGRLGTTSLLLGVQAERLCTPTIEPTCSLYAHFFFLGAIGIHQGALTVEKSYGSKELLNTRWPLLNARTQFLDGRKGLWALCPPSRPRLSIRAYHLAGPVVILPGVSPSRTISKGVVMLRCSSMYAFIVRISSGITSASVALSAIFIGSNPS